ncbi:hypothetical protein HK099_003834 [Clydaea vesicula]|uniref:Hydroxysteroid dehydrogenase-like protein 2 n=1 Tax=Clydaea vesicula TaxID=447962 RepID=A0AAD5Y004_9FUNG|nr:hypothetical protein HK099_003834 [Clydaea vesicula]
MKDIRLKGKTVFITGGSRGIGLEVAVRLAKEGANIAIAAKTAEPHPKLPGTIYTAAKDIEAAGGKALPLICDIRFENDIQNAVNKTVEKFGGIDILINNASAIDLVPMEQATLKKYDLMNQINARGTWLTSKIVLPHLINSSKLKRNPMILMMSPPLDMSKKWFAPHVGYTIAKYSMSMCALGLSGELEEYGIGVNCLWPLTGIDTSAVSNVITDGEKEVMDTARKPEIMAEAAFSILSQDGAVFNGQFCIDEEVLRVQGVKNFNKFKNDPRVPDDMLMPDFFVPNEIKGKHPSAKMSKVLNSNYIEESGNDSKSDPKVNIPALFPESQQGPLDWNYHTIRQPQTYNRTHFWPRGKTLGGSSSINAMLWVRGNQADYDLWAKKYGLSNWSYENVLPIFKRMENCRYPVDETYRGKNGNIDVSIKIGLGKGPKGTNSGTKDTDENLNFDYNAETQFGAGLSQTNVWRGKRVNTNHGDLNYFFINLYVVIGYLQGLIDPGSKDFRSNLFVLTHRHVAKVVLERTESGNIKAVGVELVPEAPNISPEIIGCSKEVILCAGAVNSPQILQLSGIGNKEELEQLGVEVFVDSPEVGMNLKDHIQCSISAEDLTKTTYTDTFTSAASALFKYFTKGSGPLGCCGIESMAFSFNSFLVNTDKYAAQSPELMPPPNIQIHFLVARLNKRAADLINFRSFEGGALGKYDAFDEKLYRENFENEFKNFAAHLSGAMLCTLLKPKSTGSIKIKSKNPLEHPIIDPRYLTNDEDIQQLVDGLLECRKIFDVLRKYGYIGKENYVKCIVSELMRVNGRTFEEIVQTREYLVECVKQRSTTLYHPTTTCRMGTDARSVVDENLRVRGVKCLRVADASIMPEIVSGNTNAPSIMIGNKNIFIKKK